ncbi:LytR/AlgR family response regulator transcription factor [Gilvibacter sediminis]|uniref:LytR/AlgR family response regulator transcription factor n=1 Tax=Gilvibacter sediminis TaxID=379071 RepID=UPI002350D2D6|nr:response regulator [Gilvibacter sediminis]MDC7996453.1 response regulator [Gilvibacter sediminis]
MSLKILIVEDEPLIAVTIETALEKQGYLVIGDADSYETAEEILLKNSVDLVLLDIQLDGEKDGIDLAAHLDQHNIPYLFLTSQTDPNTIDRIKEVHPLGFIAKPFTESGLRSNIELAWHQLKKKTPPAPLIIRVNGRTHKVAKENIKYLKAYDNYCYIITEHETYLLPHTLKKQMQGLTDDRFVRIHRSYVVNIDQVTAVTKDSVLLGEEDLPMSAKNRAEVETLMSQR